MAKHSTPKGAFQDEEPHRLPYPARRGNVSFILTKVWYS